MEIPLRENHFAALKFRSKYPSHLIKAALVKRLELLAVLVN